MSRHVFMLGVAVCVLSVGFLLTDRLLYPSCLDYARRVRVGMTRQQVEAVFGRLADDTTRSVVEACRSGLRISRWQAWEGRTGCVAVHFVRDPSRHDEVVRRVKFVHRSTRGPLHVSGEPDPIADLDFEWQMRFQELMRADQSQPPRPLKRLRSQVTK
jgi:hypothetical protein